MPNSVLLSRWALGPLNKQVAVLPENVAVEDREGNPCIVSGTYLGVYQVVDYTTFC